MEFGLIGERLGHSYSAEIHRAFGTYDYELCSMPPEAGAPFLQISDVEFSNLMALTQMTPGPIGVNGATFFGYRLAGIPGAVAASALLLLPGSLLVYAALRSLEKFASSAPVRGILRGAKPASVALMLSALLVFAGQSVASGGMTAVSLCAAAFVLMWRKTLGPMAVIAGGALASCLVYGTLRFLA
jgi:chromate transporter